METRSKLNLFLLVLAILMAVAFGPAVAEEKKLGWADSADLSFVVTGGNSETETFSFKNKLTRTWDDALFRLDTGGIRVETTTRQRAVDTSGNELEAKITDLTAENYYLNGLYDRDITHRLFWHVGAGWDRNTFAGIQNRYTYVGGLGNTWVSTDTLNWRTIYSGTFTDQEDVDPIVGADDTFFGAQLTSDFKVKFGENSAYENLLIADFNLDDSEDWRADWIHAVSVSMTSNLALKASLQFLFDNQPSFTEVDEVTGPFPPGTPTGSTDFLELDNLDTLFTTSLVISF